MMTNLDKNLDAILITGPTASGKSAFALKLAKEHGGVVVNADSMQVYDTLQVLSARPSSQDMQGVEHSLYGHVPATHLYSTGEWLRDASAEIDRLRFEKRLPVIVGGTGLYFKALLGGLSAIPAIPDDIRAHFRERALVEGSAALHAELQSLDPEMALSLNPSDAQRIIRALEVLKATGKSLSEFKAVQGDALIDPARAQKFVVLPERPMLHDRINRRFELMMDLGAEAEVRSLLALNPQPDATSLKAIGVAQIAQMFKGEMTRAEVIEKSSAATRQYAKRQMTWFRNQMGDDWERVSP
jgi:tRNA dimethylallyltransferase